MKAYILSVVGAVLLSAVIAVIAPSGKTGKFLRGATRLVTLFVLLSPLKELLGETPLSVGSSSSLQADEEYLSYCARELAAEDEQAIGAWILEEYGAESVVRVERNADATFSYQKIAVELCGGGISAGDEHIYIIAEIEAALEERFGCDAEVV